MPDLRAALAADAPGLLARLDAAPQVTVRRPRGDELVRELLTLTVPHEQVDDVLSWSGRIERDDDLRRLVERCSALVLDRLGSVTPPSPLVPLPASLGPARCFVYLYAILGVLPHVRAYHRARGVPDDVSEATLADVGRHVAVHHWGTGRPGLAPDAGQWLWLHVTGQLYDLGRLQFQRVRIGRRTSDALTAAGLPYGYDDPALSVHIPRFVGPLDPDACDRAFARAAAFFPRCFPAEPASVGVCKSWLLDPELADLLPETSNIVRFQRRFTLTFPAEVADDEPLMFVFGRTGPIDGLPQDTSLQRALVGRRRAGRHGYVGTGWTTL